MRSEEFSDAGGLIGGHIGRRDIQVFGDISHLPSLRP
jgi:hypothetical protein